ncbi:hypothetical protein ACFLYK_02755 [Candidatus Cloacimonadota bacterium]
MRIRVLTLLFILICFQQIYPISLKEAFDTASSQDGYDKFLDLNTGEIYTGGLLIGKVFDQRTSVLYGEDGLNVRIQGNGAILDLQGSEICISCCENYLDVEDCIIVNGNVRFRGMDNSMFDQRPWGSVRYVTFYQPHDYGVRLQGTGENITVERNIIVDAVDTDRDYIFTNGVSTNWLPTGSALALSAFPGIYGYPEVEENWTFHTDPETNSDPLRHIIKLCEYG